MNENVLVISKEPRLSLPLVRSLGAAGHPVHLAEPRRWSIASLSRHCRRYLPLAPAALDGSADAVVDLVATYCERERIHVVVPADVPATSFVEAARRQLPTRVSPCPPRDTLERFDDKWEFTRLLAQMGVPHPRTILLGDVRDASRLSWPAARFIKPARGSFWEGAARLDTRADLDRYARREAARLRPPFILQDFIPGEDVDVSVLALEGRVIASATQRAGADPHAVTFVREPRLEAIVRELVRRTRYHGVLHVDMRIDARTGSPVVFEGNPRFWASLSYATWAGLNFAELGVRAALGERLGGEHAVREGTCRKPTLGLRETLHALVGEGLLGEGWSDATRAAWWCSLSDPLPSVGAILQARCDDAPRSRDGWRRGSPSPPSARSLMGA